jgi:flagellar motor switch protein FliG
VQAKDIKNILNKIAENLPNLEKEAVIQIQKGHDSK